jgi:hypothetical protein
MRNFIAFAIVTEKLSCIRDIWCTADTADFWWW